MYELTLLCLSILISLLQFLDKIWQCEFRKSTFTHLQLMHVWRMLEKLSCPFIIYKELNM